ncbi:hypothetical protein O181_026789 [Austropuccinia psidii MF-1]|uniref:NEDD8-activating enzyme E1 regulatory subunit n=1 Tax=Austropuccinia psidii MF-1 TaxID=1389203 RepID=A0A9Q3H1Y8_9BASI|nr:hypothetical protein [Austropuccinia psidii MF-1]
MKRACDQEDDLQAQLKFTKNMTDNNTMAEAAAPLLTPHVSDTVRPDLKTQRYDRQLRLWDVSGQNRLENAKMMISPVTATSSQILKNLVLAGLSYICLIDPDLVRQSDIGNNFFLDQSSLGKSRAEECARFLKELNSDVWFQPDEAFLQPGIFDRDLSHGLTQMNVVVGVRLTEQIEELAAEECWYSNVPFISVQTCGLIASIRMQIRELGLIETHPNSLADLRLDSPFPDLLDFVSSFEMKSLDGFDHAHIPAVVIIIHFLELFKTTHDGNLPKNSAERNELKKMILSEQRNSDEDNFDEAVSMIARACNPTTIPSHIQELFSDKYCDEIPPFQSTFWLLVRTLREFVKRGQENGSPAQLPLSGVLPDMKSDTNNYVQLKSIYRRQATQDLMRFKSILSELLEALPVPTDLMVLEDESDTAWPDISDESIEIFVKHSAHLRLIRGRSIEQESTQPRSFGSQLLLECQSDEEPSSLIWYLALKACAQFRSMNNGRYPGAIRGQEQADFDSLQQLLTTYLNKHGWTQPLDQGTQLPLKLEKSLKEIVNSAGAELPQMSALVGGMAAQEALKVITKQYIPLNGTCIIDAIKSCTSVLNL